MEDFVKKLIPTLINYFFPIVIKRINRVQEMVTLNKPDPLTTNNDEVDS